MRSLLSSVLIVAVLSGCGGRQPTNLMSVGSLRRGMTFEQARRAAGAPHAVIRRPQLIRGSGNPHSPFSQVWVYVKQLPWVITYVYFDRAGRIVSIQPTRGGRVASFG